MFLLGFKFGLGMTLGGLLICSIIIFLVIIIDCFKTNVEKRIENKS